MTATDQTAAALLWGVATAVAMVVLVPAAAWLTARVGARAQGRRPRRRPGPFGVLVPLARAAALLTAGEDPRPPRDGLLRAWVPVAVLLAAALGFGVAALAPASGQGMAAAEPALGLLLLAAAGVYLGHAAALAAPAAAGPKATRAALRAVTTHAGAAVAWILCLVALAAVHGTAQVSAIGQAQARLLGPVPAWNLWLQPLGFCTYLAAALAVTQHPPFTPAAGLGADAAFTGVRWGLLVAGRHAFLLAVALGGTYLYLGGGHLPGLSTPGGPSFLAAVAVKTLAVMVLLALLGAALPRLTGRRSTQVAWKVMVPVAALNLVLAPLLALFVPQP